MSPIRDFLAFAERQSAAIDNAVKAAAKQPRTEAIPGEVFYPAADVEAASNIAEFERLERAAKGQATRDGLAGHLAPKLDEVADAYGALLQAAEESVERKQYLGQGRLIRLETAIGALEGWAHSDADRAKPLAITVESAKHPVRRKRRPHTLPSERKLTPNEVTTLKVVGECGGNVAKAARQLGKHQSTVNEQYRNALAKLPRLAKAEFKDSLKRLPSDKRGQVTAATIDPEPAE